MATRFISLTTLRNRLSNLCGSAASPLLSSSAFPVQAAPRKRPPTWLSSQKWRYLSGDTFNLSRYRRDGVMLGRGRCIVCRIIVTTKLFSELGLSSELLKAIDRLGFEQAAPIQAEAIPLLLQGKDVVGQSQTGSGKTVAFAAPALDKVTVEERVTQVLILCPTRELAVQVAEEVHKLALFKRGLHALPVYGGQSYDRQLFGLRQGAHVVIGTPGRIMDHMRRGTLRLNSLKMVVLDEVDVMLNKIGRAHV